MRRSSLITQQPSAQQQLRPLAIHLYPNHFTLQDSDTSYKYSGPLKCIIDAVNKLEIPEDAIDLFPPECFFQGSVVVDVYDHRFASAPSVASAPATQSNPKQATGQQSVPTFTITSTNSVVTKLEHASDAPNSNAGSSSSTPTFINMPNVQPRRMFLRHSPKTFQYDVAHFGCKIASSDKTPWTEEATIELQARLLPMVEEPLMLDPNIDVLRKATLESYNRNKFIYERGKKRTAEAVEKRERESAAQETSRIMLMMEKDREFFPQFRQLSFIEDWRNKRRIADSEVLLGLEDRNKLKPGAYKRLQFNQNRKIVRTLRYRQAIKERTIYTILNVYDIGNGLYEGVLRWGDEEGTSLGPISDTMHFDIGNKIAVEYFVGHFKGFYGIDHKLVSDSVPADSSTLSAAAAAAAVAAGAPGSNNALAMPSSANAGSNVQLSSPDAALLQSSISNGLLAVPGAAASGANAGTNPQLLSLNLQLQQIQQFQQQQQQLQQMQKFHQIQQQLQQQAGQQGATPNLFGTTQLTPQQKMLNQQQLMAALAQSQQASLTRNQQQHLTNLGLNIPGSSVSQPAIGGTQSNQPGPSN